MTIPRKVRLSLQSLAGLAIRWPWRVLAAAILILIGLAYEARGLGFEPRIDLLSPNDDLARAEKARLETFGPDFRALAALMKPREEGGVLTLPSLEALSDLHRELETAPGVRRVASLVNSPVLVGARGAPAGSPVWPVPTPDGKETILSRLDPSVMQRYMFLSQRDSLVPFYLELDERAPEPDLVRRLGEIAAGVEKRHPGAGRVLVVGPAVVETSLGEHVFDDLHRLVPFTVGVMVLLLVLVLRNGAFLFVTIVHSLALVVVVLGGMAASGLSVNLVNVLAPIIVVPIGVAPLLHLLVRLRSGADAGEETAAGPILRAAVARLEGAMLGTTGTTAVGFLGFLISPVPAIRQFGLILSAGALAALLITVTLDVAVLALLWRSRKPAGARRPRKASTVERWLLGMTRSRATLLHRSRRGVIACIWLAAAGLLSLADLRIDDTWLRNFDPGSPIARDAELFEQEFLGTNILSVTVEADPASPGSRDRALDLVNRLPARFMGIRGVRAGLSVASLARSLDPNQGWPWEPWPTPTVEKMSDACHEWERRGAPLPRARMLATPDLSRLQVLGFVINDHLWELERVVDAAKALAEGSNLPGVTAKLGGNLAANIRMVRLAVIGQGYSLAALLVTMAALAVFYTRSLRAGMMIVAPMGLAVLSTYFIVVNFGIPYGVAVSMFPTLMIGVAVDFAIHIHSALVRNREASRTRWCRDVAIVVQGILLNGAIWSIGFSVLAGSHLPPNRYLGLLCSAVIGFSTLLSLFMLPTAALASGDRRPRHA